MKFYRLFFLLIAGLCACAAPPQVRVEVQDDGALFTEAGDTVLFYRTGPPPEPSVRTNYVHPLLALDGQVLTEDAPADHPHHRGVFWAWHQLWVDSLRVGDGWDMTNVGWTARSVEALDNGPARGVVAEVDWSSPLLTDHIGTDVPFVRERTTVRVYPATAHYRLVDFDLSLRALRPGVRIGGSEDAKGYGGFSPRIRLVDSLQFLSATGEVEPQNLPFAAGGWMNVVGALGQRGATAGVAMLEHPDNPGHPNPWILRRRGSMQNVAYPGRTPVDLSGNTPLRLRYRLVIHDGDASVDVGALHAAYGRE
ncbi:MAG: DUF6807 family protein [Catalinimonas sp.]